MAFKDPEIQPQKPQALTEIGIFGPFASPILVERGPQCPHT